MSTIQYTTKDLKLFAKIMLLPGYSFFITIVSILPLYDLRKGSDFPYAIIAVLIFGCLGYLLVKQALLQVLKYSLKKQSADGIMTVRITDMGVEETYSEVRFMIKWSLLTRRAEVFGCYFLRAPMGLPLIYKKSELSGKERECIELNTKKTLLTLFF